MEFFVEIVEIKTGVVDQRMVFDSQRQAEKAERGVLRNLNTDEYFVRIVTE